MDIGGGWLSFSCKSLPVLEDEFLYLLGSCWPNAGEICRETAAWAKDSGVRPFSLPCVLAIPNLTVKQWFSTLAGITWESF